MLSAIMMLLISIIQLVIGDSYQLALALAIVTMATGLILGNRRSLRTRYRSLPWGREEFVVLISSLLAIALTSLTVDKWLAIPLFLVAIAPLSVTAKVVKST
jgi:hypothetical protein